MANDSLEYGEPIPARCRDVLRNGTLRTAVCSSGRASTYLSPSLSEFARFAFSSFSADITDNRWFLVNAAPSAVVAKQRTGNGAARVPSIRESERDRFPGEKVTKGERIAVRVGRVGRRGRDVSTKRETWHERGSGPSLTLPLPSGSPSNVARQVQH